MSVAWMLADTNLLKQLLGTSSDNSNLGLPAKVSKVERIADPKEVIKNAIAVSQESLSRRRRKLSISSLYSPISQEISLEKLANLPSYQDFVKEVDNSLQYLNYL